jgi:hypothetical protein
MAARCQVLLHRIIPSQSSELVATARHDGASTSSTSLCPTGDHNIAAGIAAPVRARSSEDVRYIEEHSPEQQVRHERLGCEDVIERNISPPAAPNRVSQRSTPLSMLPTGARHHAPGTPLTEFAPLPGHQLPSRHQCSSDRTPCGHASHHCGLHATCVWHTHACRTSRAPAAPWAAALRCRGHAAGSRCQSLTALALPAFPPRSPRTVRR